MRVIDCEQGSTDWLQARVGKITASRMADVLAYLKRGGETEKRANYRLELAAERLTGMAQEAYVSPEMKWGIENEDYARTAYELKTGNFLDRIGFALHYDYDFAGASPDGLFDSHGGVEIKCPKTTTHLRYMADGVVPEEYRPQMHWVMACCEREWLDFVSFDPRLPEDLQLFIATMERDNAEIERITAEVVAFDASITELIDKLRGHHD